MNLKQVVEVVLSIRLAIGLGSPTPRLDLGVVHVSRQQHLQMSVHHRRRSARETIPDHQVVTGLRVFLVSQLGPSPGHIQIVIEPILSEAQRIVFVENNQAVVTVQLDQAAGGDTVLATHSTGCVAILGKSICWREGFGVAKGIVTFGLGCLGNLFDRGAGDHIERTSLKSAPSMVTWLVTLMMY